MTNTAVFTGPDGIERSFEVSDEEYTRALAYIEKYSTLISETDTIQSRLASIRKEIKELQQFNTDLQMENDNG